jgi:hypothetical protein
VGRIADQHGASLAPNRLGQLLQIMMEQFTLGQRRQHFRHGAGKALKLSSNRGQAGLAWQPAGRRLDQKHIQALASQGNHADAGGSAPVFEGFSEARVPTNASPAGEAAVTERNRTERVGPNRRIDSIGSNQHSALPPQSR